MIADPKKAKTPELEAELALYREAGIEDVADAAALTNNAKRAEEIERLTKAHGMPVKLDAEFIKENPTLAKLLKESGAEEGEIVFAEEADTEKAAALDAEAAKRDELVKELAKYDIEPVDVSALTTEDLEAKLAEAKASKNTSSTAPKEEQTPVGAKEQVYQEHDEDGVAHGLVYTVASVNNVLFNGKSYKDVTLVNGETRRITPKQFEIDVTDRA